MKQAIILFTRVPLPGMTKTRMMPTLNEKQCAELHTCFLKDIRKECEQCGADIFVCYTPEDKEGILRKILGDDKQYFPQRGSSLGTKMYHAIDTVLKKGYDACLLMGTDVPEIRSEYLKNAFRILKKKDLVFGRTMDGGYYLVGMKQARKEAFGLSTYGHAHVWEDTRKHLECAGLTVGYIPKLQDMDTESDLAEFRTRMRKNKRRQNTKTGSYLMRKRNISVIIPLYNEEKTIVALQKQLEKIKGKCQILFVDGGSTDNTLGKIQSGYTVIHSGKGRARQMNEGARASSGDILFFLHCDSKLPPKPLAEIRYVMKDYQAGCFGIAFETKKLLMKICAFISNHRIKDRKVMFGDQGIFIERRLFFELGMFPDIPIMEDYQFSLNIKEKGIPLGMTKRRIYTSDRRFPVGIMAKLELMWKMNRLRKMYRDGVSVKKLSALYDDIR